MEERERVELLFRFIEICQNGFVRPDNSKVVSDNRDSRKDDNSRSSANTTGVVRDSKDLKDFAIAACVKVSKILDFHSEIVIDLSNSKNRYEKWD
jgi:hypothetical protein